VRELRHNALLCLDAHVCIVSHAPGLFLASCPTLLYRWFPVHCLGVGYCILHGLVHHAASQAAHVSMLACRQMETPAARLASSLPSSHQPDASLMTLRFYQLTASASDRQLQLSFTPVAPNSGSAMINAMAGGQPFRRAAAGAAAGRVRADAVRARRRGRAAGPAVRAVGIPRVRGAARARRAHRAGRYRS
jgi:hypothetical protein